MRFDIFKKPYYVLSLLIIFMTNFQLFLTKLNTTSKDKT